MKALVPCGEKLFLVSIDADSPGCSLASLGRKANALYARSTCVLLAMWGVPDTSGSGWLDRLSPVLVGSGRAALLLSRLLCRCVERVRDKPLASSDGVW